MKSVVIELVETRTYHVMVSAEEATPAGLLSVEDKWRTQMVAIMPSTLINTTVKATANQS